MATFSNVELARVGNFTPSVGPRHFSKEMLQSMADSFTDLQGKIDIPLKLGHNAEQKLLQKDGLPAAGWVSNVRISGATLVGDFVNVPDTIANLIRSGAYRKRSIEAVKDATMANKTYDWVLVGVALLGNELPAVDSLKDIAEIYSTLNLNKPAFAEKGSELIFASIDSSDLSDNVLNIQGEFSAIIERAYALTSKSTTNSNWSALAAQFQNEIKEKTPMSLKTVIEKLELAEDADEHAVIAAIEKLQEVSESYPEKEKEKETETESSEFNDLKKLLAEQKQTIVQMQNAAAQQEVTGIVDKAITDKKFVPATRDNLISIGLQSKEDLNKLIASTPSIVSSELGTSSTSTSNGKFDVSDFEPTKDELNIAASLGVSREDIIREKAEEIGTIIPDNFFIKESEKKDE